MAIVVVVVVWSSSVCLVFVLARRAIVSCINSPHFAQRQGDRPKRFNQRSTKIRLRVCLSLWFSSRTTVFEKHFLKRGNWLALKDRVSVIVHFCNGKESSRNSAGVLLGWSRQCRRGGNGATVSGHSRLPNLRGSPWLWMVSSRATMQPGLSKQAGVFVSW